MAAATDKDYSALQDIREEAGHQNLMKTETPSGSANGTNKVFTVGRTYIVDRNYNDTIDVGVVNGDVIVYDDGVAVEVQSVDATTGVITLTSAPASSSKILVTYAYSLLSDIAVGKFRSKAIDFVHKGISEIINFGEWTDADDDTGVPHIIKTIVQIYAAGLILIRDHGLNADLENSSKDGYKKIAWAKNALEEYIAEAGSSTGATARITASSKSDGNIFERNTDLSTWNATKNPTEQFMRGDC